MRVLLVEGNLGNAQLERSLLARARYGRFTVVTTDSLSAMSEALRASAFDAALPDLSLPDVPETIP